MRRITFIFVSLVLAGVLLASDMPELPSLKESNLQAHVNFLAHDLLEGRGTGTRGYDLAALYVATQFELLGLLPGTGNGYLQNVPLRKTKVLAEKCKLTIHGKEKALELKYGIDYLMSGDYLRKDTSVTAEVVFAGFGVTANELQYDDYAGIDAKGKIVLLISSAPDSFPASARAHYSSATNKKNNAVAHGAVGMISFRNPQDLERSPWERSVRQNKLPGYRWLEAPDKPHDAPPQIRGSASLSPSGAEVLFSHSPVTLKEVYEMWTAKKLRSFPLGATVSLQSVSQHDNVSSPNVVGVFEGSDPQLKKEYIVYTAHLDHLGISDPVNNDTINNGAYDNATGIAALIEMARAFTQLKEKPRRSVMFLAVTAEEKGLQGADYFAHNPTVPIESIVANINTDMFLMLYPFSDAIALGAEHSSLGPIADRAFNAVGLKRVPDPAPEEVRFVRSDQYAFIKKGIPAIKLMSGFGSLESTINGADATRKWLRSIYHSPQDESSQKMHWESGIKIVQITFLIGYEVANTSKRPAWNPGDFFGKTFANHREHGVRGAERRE